MRLELALKGFRCDIALLFYGTALKFLTALMFFTFVLFHKDQSVMWSLSSLHHPSFLRFCIPR